MSEGGGRSVAVCTCVRDLEAEIDSIRSEPRPDYVRVQTGPPECRIQNTGYAWCLSLETSRLTHVFLFSLLVCIQILTGGWDNLKPLGSRVVFDELHYRNNHHYHSLTHRHLRPSPSSSSC